MLQVGRVSQLELHQSYNMYKAVRSQFWSIVRNAQGKSKISLSLSLSLSAAGNKTTEEGEEWGDNSDRGMEGGGKVKT